MKTTKTPEAMADGERRNAMKIAFMEAYGLRPYKYGVINFRALFRQGGAGNDAVKRVLRDAFAVEGRMSWLGDPDGKGYPFDHHELYGRDGVPLFLVGHPYNVDPVGRSKSGRPYISEEAADTLRQLRSLDMSVRVLDQTHSWYSSGTSLIAVYHWPTVRAVCGPCSLFPPKAKPKLQWKPKWLTDHHAAA